MIIYNGKEYSRAIIIGDIHGCYDELWALLDKVVDEKQKDLVICVGDLVDRGPEAPMVIGLFQEKFIKFDLLSIKGNHDDKFCRRKRNDDRAIAEPGYINKMRPFLEHNEKQYKLLSQRDHDWLKSLPAFIKFRVTYEIYDRWAENKCFVDQDYLVVHGGFLSYIPPEKQDLKVICRLRYVDKDTGKMVSKPNSFEQPANTVFWTEKWNRSERVIYGHEAREEVNINNGCYGLDTSCCYGNKLTAMIIDSNNQITFESVKAKQVYWDKKVPG